MRRISLAVLVLVLTSCRHGAFYEQSRVANQCPGSGNAPIVCIDATTLAASPDPIHVEHGQWVHFFFVSGNDELTIDSGVLENKDHQGGHACASARPRRSDPLKSPSSRDPTAILKRH